ncbi:hypothetical protein [Cerasicoccus arenae]|uniref:Uncharacterized protein n=1 Tax=Cerasicoccus arenae TaxID=424488 RepID=A0A8J3GD38_9BACT|nr:hypothetical protein [Cerasicoccus arenae]MBK1859697.1 hypothetical protein [Cerasicoccus arenae]GHC03755.1 hypothetical protein GCM10007047_20540 [Cerasicoccus arenae]
MQYRHGDVMIERISQKPSICKKLSHRVLALGEITGHSHRIAENSGATLFQSGSDLFLEVSAPEVSVIHEEHNTIPLATGVYRIWRQREYSPEEIRIIRD